MKFIFLIKGNIVFWILVGKYKWYIYIYILDEIDIMEKIYLNMKNIILFEKKIKYK